MFSSIGPSIFKQTLAGIVAFHIFFCFSNMDDKNHLLQPLIQHTTIATSVEASTLSVSQITRRLAFVFCVGIISIWGNHEASKGFDIVIVNDIRNASLSHRFDIFFVKNDKAIRIVLNTSSFAENILYPDQNQPKKPIHRVTLRLSDHQSSRDQTLVLANSENEYVLQIGSWVMAETNVQTAMVSSVQQGMARIWLWNGAGDAPKTLVDGMVEYISNVVELSSVQDTGMRSLSGRHDECWKDKNFVAVANFLRYCDKRKNGVIGRLNDVIKAGWDERMVDLALGSPARQLCASYYSSQMRIL